MRLFQNAERERVGLRSYCGFAVRPVAGVPGAELALPLSGRAFTHPRAVRRSDVFDRETVIR